LRRRAAFDALVGEAIAARRARGAGAASAVADADLLRVLLDARYEDGGAMSEEEIRNHLLTLILAGHETTAIAIAWGVHWLLREPAVLARLRDELDTLGDDPSAEALARAPYLGATCDEVLRIRPILPDAVRPVNRPLALGEWSIPAGEGVVVALHTILTDPSTFPDPERFRPERFLERRYTPAEFPPFGGGHRRCLGAAFAENELRVVLGTIAAKWDLALADTRPERSVRRNVTMAPASGIRVRVLGPR
jgi:cytochrome P450